MPSALSRLWTRLAAAADWRAALLAEHDRWGLWLPVAMGLGIALYFAWPSEPPGWVGPAAMALAMALGWIGRGRSEVLALALGLAMLGGGMAIVQHRASDRAAPVLERRIGPVTVLGRVVEVQDRAEGSRLILEKLAIARLDGERMPARIRVNLRAGQADVRPGDQVRLTAFLLPPPQPAAPGAYDLARDAWFQRLGAVGYATGQVRVIETGGGNTVTEAIERLRHDITRHVRAAIPGASGAIAAAMMTGEQGGIAPELLQAWRDSGLAHMLSISGLHFVLLAGVVFAVVRRGLALSEYAALYWPLKKIAAVVAWVAALGYLLISGASVPTQRSFVMLSIGLLAVLVDRSPFSPRLVAIAALAVLAWTPEALLGASFQMSFAAVLALIAAHEVYGARLRAWRAEGGAVRGGLYWLALSLLTALVAGLATAPYAAYHFDRFSSFGVFANMLAVPVASFWVMPLVVAAFALMPFGLDGWALAGLGLGIDLLSAMAKTVAAWPGAAWTLPAMPLWGMAAVTLGGLWLCLWRQAWRRLGWVGVVGGCLSPFVTPTPDLLVDAEGRALAIKSAEGGLMVDAPRGGDFAVQTWLRRAGEDRALPWPRGGVSADGRLRCDIEGCVWRTEGRVVALPRTARAVEEDCRMAEIVVTALPVRGRCPSARLVIDGEDLRRRGAHALWLGAGGPRLESVGDWRGTRPWAREVPPEAARTRGGSGSRSR
ncbi:MAG: ComEC/Rec2 family competence protein [Alphaproteobacteria bacterium]|nr:ComEC/Rec2 family competence protein [Alphaproteobacteria bacterium]